MKIRVNQSYFATRLAIAVILVVINYLFYI